MRSAKPGNHLKRRFPASQKILCTVWFICLFFFVSEWKRSIVHTWVCLTEKNSSISRVYIFDGLYHRQGGGERANSKVRNRLILQTVPVCNPYAQINLLSGKGKTDRKSGTATAQLVISVTEVTAAEINRDHVYASMKWGRCIDSVIDLTSQF